MIVLQGLHGRARLRLASRSRRRLFALLLAILGVLGLASLTNIIAGRVNATPLWALTASRVGMLGPPVTCASPLLAGLLIDRFGLRRVIAVALVVWCGAASLAVVILPPLALSVVATLEQDILNGFVLTGAVVALRLALAPRRRAPALAALLVAYGYARHPSFDLYRLVMAATRAEVAMLAFCAVGALVVALWLFGFREVDPDTKLDLRASPSDPGASLHGVADILSLPIVWTLLALQLCHSLVYPLVFDRPWSFELMRLGILDKVALTLACVAPIASILAAIWSDWALRRTRSLRRSRQPFAVLGFSIVCAATLASTRPHVSEIAIAALGAAGIASVRMIDVLEIDLAPRALAGRFFGVLGGAEAFLALYVAPIFTSVAHQVHAVVPMLVGASAAGAGLSLLLLRRLPNVRPD